MLGFKDASKMYHGCFKDVSRIIQECFKIPCLKCSTMRIIKRFVEDASASCFCLFFICEGESRRVKGSQGESRGVKGSQEKSIGSKRS